jgi:hypothetical protein
MDFLIFWAQKIPILCPLDKGFTDLAAFLNFMGGGPPIRPGNYHGATHTNLIVSFLIFPAPSRIVANHPAVQEKAHCTAQDLWWLADGAGCRRRLHVDPFYFSRIIQPANVVDRPAFGVARGVLLASAASVVSHRLDCVPWLRA